MFWRGCRLSLRHAVANSARSSRLISGFSRGCQITRENSGVALRRHLHWDPPFRNSKHGFRVIFKLYCCASQELLGLFARCNLQVEWPEFAISSPGTGKNLRGGNPDDLPK
jgi:hypothetical protein